MEDDTGPVPNITGLEDFILFINSTNNPSQYFVFLPCLTLSSRDASKFVTGRVKAVLNKYLENPDLTEAERGIVMK